MQKNQDFTKTVKLNKMQINGLLLTEEKGKSLTHNF